MLNFQLLVVSFIGEGKSDNVSIESLRVAKIFYSKAILLGEPTHNFDYIFLLKLLLY